MAHDVIAMGGCAGTGLHPEVGERLNPAEADLALASSLFPMHIPEGLYTEIVKRLPIVCVDVIVRSQGRVMLVRRKNEPLSGEWWVPGGRVKHGESAAD